MWTTAPASVRFWEMLVEKGSGMSSGMDDVGPGIGFKAGTYKTGGKERSGNIEEASSLFGKDFSYQWDYAAVRTALQQVTAAAGLRLGDRPQPEVGVRRTGAAESGEAAARRRARPIRQGSRSRPARSRRPA